MAKASKAHQRAVARYNAKAYDRIELRVPKGRKRAIEAAARRCGQTINRYLNGLIRGDLGLTEGEWRVGEDDGPD